MPRNIPEAFSKALPHFRLFQFQVSYLGSLRLLAAYIFGLYNIFRGFSFPFKQLIQRLLCRVQRKYAEEN